MLIFKFIANFLLKTATVLIIFASLLNNDQFFAQMGLSSSFNKQIFDITLKTYFSLNFFVSENGLSHPNDVKCEGVGGHFGRYHLVLGY